jgi:hypothetical protein
MKRAIMAIAMSTALATAHAQDVLLPTTSWGFVPVVAGWHFNTPVAQSSGAVSDVAQIAVPFRVSFRLGGQWSADITGAYATSAIHMAKSDSSGGNGGNGNGGNGNGGGGGDAVQVLSGPTDLKLRVTGPIHGDALQMTFGLNIPTGTTKLSSDQTAVLEATAAPALHMPVASYGTGFGGTIGVVSAVETGDWTLAFGAAVEQRSEYTPIAIALASGTSDTQVTPGTAAHLSVGADHVVGEGRLGLLLLGDVFTKDQVNVGTSGVSSGSTSYTLGPQLTALARMDFGASRWRESGAALAVRYRSAYTDATNTKVAGSDATYVEGTLGGVLGSAGSTGLILSADARWHSGMTFTDALVGAAVTAAGVTIGVESSGGGFRFALHPEYGSFSTGTTKTTGFGGSLTFSFAARRDQ